MYLRLEGMTNLHLKNWRQTSPEMSAHLYLTARIIVGGNYKHSIARTLYLTQYTAIASNYFMFVAYMCRLERICLLMKAQ